MFDYVLGWGDNVFSRQGKEYFGIKDTCILEDPKNLLAGLLSSFIAVFVAGAITYGLVWLFGGFLIIGDNVEVVLIGVFFIAWWIIFIWMLTYKGNK